MISRPKDILSSILNRMDLKWEPELLDFHIQNRSKTKEPKELMAWKKKTLEPIDGSNKSVYKELLSKRQVELFENEAIECLTKFGFAC